MEGHNARPIRNRDRTLGERCKRSVSSLKVQAGLERLGWRQWARNGSNFKSGSALTTLWRGLASLVICAGYRGVTAMKGHHGRRAQRQAANSVPAFDAAAD